MYGRGSFVRSLRHMITVLATVCRQPHTEVYIWIYMMQECTHIMYVKMILQSVLASFFPRAWGPVPLEPGRAEERTRTYVRIVWYVPRTALPRCCPAAVCTGAVPFLSTTSCQPGRPPTKRRTGMAPVAHPPENRHDKQQQQQQREDSLSLACCVIIVIAACVYVRPCPTQILNKRSTAVCTHWNKKKTNCAHGRRKIHYAFLLKQKHAKEIIFPPQKTKKPQPYILLVASLRKRKNRNHYILVRKYNVALTSGSAVSSCYAVVAPWSALWP